MRNTGFIPVIALFVQLSACGMATENTNARSGTSAEATAAETNLSADNLAALETHAGAQPAASVSNQIDAFSSQGKPVSNSFGLLDHRVRCTAGYAYPNGAGGWAQGWSDQVTWLSQEGVLYRADLYWLSSHGLIFNFFACTP